MRDAWSNHFVCLKPESPAPEGLITMLPAGLPISPTALAQLLIHSGGNGTLLTCSCNASNSPFFIISAGSVQLHTQFVHTINRKINRNSSPAARTPRRLAHFAISAAINLFCVDDEVGCIAFTDDNLQGGGAGCVHGTLGVLLAEICCTPKCVVS